MATDRLGESSVQLFARVHAGDDDALEALYLRYLEPLQRWSRGRLPRWARDEVDTDDLVQDTLLRSLRSVRRFQPEWTGAFQVYLRRSIRNRIRDEIRKVNARPKREGLLGDEVDRSPSPVSEAIGREQLNRFEQALARLQPTDQEAIVARIELDLPYRELAQVLGKPSPDSARMTVTRALARLAEEMVRVQA